MGSLLQGYRSNEYQFLLDVIGRFYLEREVSRKKISELLTENLLENSYFLDELKRQGLLREENGSYQPAGRLAPFLPPLSNLERETLTEILATEEAGLFLSGREQPPESSLLDSIQAITPEGKDLPSQLDPAVFHVILTGILNRRLVRHTWRTKSSPDEHVSVLLPWRLEYQAYDGRWWVIFYSEEEDRTIKARLDNILSASLEGGCLVPEEKIRASILRQISPEPLVLDIRNEKNAWERCFIAFDDALEMDGEKLSPSVCRLRLRYLRFDEMEVIKKLMYLGECVTVVSPDHIRNALILRLRKALEVQKGNDETP